MTPTKPAMFLWRAPAPALFEALAEGREVDCPPGLALWVNSAGAVPRPGDWACYLDGRWMEPKPGDWAKLVEMLPNGLMTGRMISAQLCERPDSSRYWRPGTITNE